MFDYPLARILLCVLVVVLTPKSLDRVIGMRLKKVSIAADRTSPALAAVQDALTLKDLEFELEQREKTSTKKNDVKRVNLKGMKISLDDAMKSIESKVRIQELALRGEQIEVRHFSDKFIYNKLKSENMISISSGDVKVLAYNKDDKKRTLPQVALSSDQKVTEQQASAGAVMRVDEAKLLLANETLVARNTPVQKIVRTAPLDNVNPIRLKGSIELEGGSFTRSETFTYYIERKHQGKTFEAVSLRGDQSDYQIDLIDDKGFLTVELRSPAGEILAYGEADLKRNERKIDLTLEPSAGLFAGQSVETDALELENSDAPEIAVADSKTFVAGVEGTLNSDNEGFFGDQNLFSKKSEFLSSTVKKNYWPTLSLTEAGKSHYPRLVKRSVIDRLEGDLDPFGEAVKIESLLLGKVTHEGLSRSNLKVEVFGQGYQRPIYFSDKGRPDTSLQKTSVHGGFVFTNLPDGGYLVQVLSGEVVLSQKWFVVRSGHISRGQIDLRQKQEKLVFLEAFPSQSRVDGELSVKEMGLSDSEVGVNSLAAELKGIELSSKTSPSVSVVEVSDESSSRQLSIIPAKSSDITLKKVSVTWLESFLNQRRSNRDSNLGLIVGFIEDSGFEVLKDSTESLTVNSEVYYFDRDGNYSSEGVSGGGFIITNTRLGFQPLVVNLKGENRFLNKVVFTSSKSISVF